MKGMMNHDRRRRTISIGQDGPFRTPDLGWLRMRKAAKTAGEGTAKGGCSESLATTLRRVGCGWKRMVLSLLLRLKQIRNGQHGKSSMSGYGI